MMFFIDANIFLEVELGDNRSEECKKFLTKVLEKKINAYTSDFLLYTSILQIETKLKSREKMEDFIVFISNLENLEIIRPNLDTIKVATDIAKKYNMTFDDGLIVACMRANDIKKLVSLDTDFDDVKEIERIEPSMAYEKEKD